MVALQRPLLESNNSALPSAFTRTVAVNHCTCMHGDGVPEGKVNGHPLIMNVSSLANGAAPPIFTRATVATACSCAA